MSIGDEFGKSQDEDVAWRERQRAKCGDYTGDDCPNCGRQRVMMGDDKKRRCEKCAWCIEDSDYDPEFGDYLR